jgi:hypothetical protein
MYYSWGGGKPDGLSRVLTRGIFLKTKGLEKKGDLCENLRRGAIQIKTTLGQHFWTFLKNCFKFSTRGHGTKYTSLKTIFEKSPAEFYSRSTVGHGTKYISPTKWKRVAFYTRSTVGHGTKYNCPSMESSLRSTLLYTVGHVGHGNAKRTNMTHRR